MKFPLVPRDIYEDVQERLRDRDREIAKLTEVIITLKVAGATVPRPGHAEPKASSVIERAINESRYVGHPSVRPALNRFVESERQKGTKDEEIAARIRAWPDLNRPDPLYNDDDDDEPILAVS